MKSFSWSPPAHQFRNCVKLIDSSTMFSALGSIWSGSVYGHATFLKVFSSSAYLWIHWTTTTGCWRRRDWLKSGVLPLQKNCSQFAHYRCFDRYFDYFDNTCGSITKVCIMLFMYSCIHSFIMSYLQVPQKNKNVKKDGSFLCHNVYCNTFISLPPCYPAS